MDLLLGLASLAALALFLSSVLRLSSAGTPLVAVGAAMLWFTLFGCFSALFLGGVLWYVLCAAALGFVVYKHKKDIKKLITPGFLFFVALGVFFILYFLYAKPMLTQWDEFTFWGTAAKATKQNNLLYTQAKSNLIARSYPPGLICFSYMMMFLGPWAEYKLMAAFSVVYLAAFSAGSGLWKKYKAGAVVFSAGMLMLPFFFEVGTGAGQASHAYLVCMSDAPMAAFFGGILCLYFSHEEKNTRLLALVCALLASLTLIKDIGFALALLALLIVFADLLFCERKTLRFAKLAKAKGLLLFLGVALVCIVASYVGWAAHLSQALEVDRFDLGSQGESRSMVSLLGTAAKSFLGIEVDPQFAAVLPMMLMALVSVPVSMIGPGVMVLALIVALLFAAWGLQTTQEGRRRVLVFAIASTLGFVAFYLFNIFTYSFIFSPAEGLVLKDYARYISPYWQAWLMGSMMMMGLAATKGSVLRLRVQLARGLSVLLSLALVVLPLLAGNLQANFLRVSPSMFQERKDVAALVRGAEQHGLQPDDRVYIISQSDDATRFYMFGYEMRATRCFMFEREAVDQNGNTVYIGNASAALVSPEEEPDPTYLYPNPCTQEQLVGYLRQEECTYLLLDEPDEYIRDAFGDLFQDGMAGWSMDYQQKIGNRYYRIEWDGDDCRFIPQKGDG